MIGRKTTTNGTHHEGNGGHAYYDYITNPADLESGHINPFWHDGGDDFAWYVSEYGDGATTLDYVIIHLGVNDMLDGTTAEQIVTNMTTFVGYIHADFPDAIVIIDGLVIPSMLCESYYNPVDQAKTVHQYNAIMEAGALAITNTFFAPVTFFFDAEHAYPYTMVAPSEGSTELVKRLTDSLHPYAPGYYQIADEALWCLLYNSSDF
jgi:lysophospholipase L1-like esterase